jgi:hypothetical protein
LLQRWMNSRNSSTIKMGAIQAINRGGAACNSRPHPGHKCRLDEAYVPQRRQRMVCDLFFGRNVPQAIQTDVDVGCSAPQCGHSCCIFVVCRAASAKDEGRVDGEPMARGWR